MGWRKSADWRRKLKGLMRAVGHTGREEAPWDQLGYYQKMLTKHIDLVKRRLIKEEKIPHSEKVFSIFQPWTELIIKGKRHPDVEFGKNLAITSDQYHLILDWELAEGRTDSQLVEGIAGRLTDKYSLQSLSVDKGFSSKKIKTSLQETIPEVVMPKKGRRTKAEKAAETQPRFKQLKNKHSAV